MKDIFMVELAKLSVHPMNPRPAPTVASVQDLAASIEQHGQLEPLIVRRLEPGQSVVAGYEILSGARRKVALESLGMDLALVRAVEAGEAEALAIMLTANEHREELDPYLEASAIEQLIHLYQGSVTDAAKRLGRPVRWVAEHRQLVTLGKAWRKVLAARDTGGNDGYGMVRHWPIWALARVAALAEKDQEEILSRWRWEHELPSRKGFTAELSQYAQQLGQAPWDLADHTLVPKAGPCLSCPKTSLSCPGLFDDGEILGDPKTAVCRDGACWQAKNAALVSARVAALKSEYSDLALVYEAEHTEAARSGPLQPTLHAYQWKPSKKGAKGAVPAMLTHGPKAGELTWIKPTVSGAPSRTAKSTQGKGTAKKPPALEERVAMLAERRTAAYVDRLRAAVPESAPGFLVVLGLMQAYGIRGRQTYAETLQLTLAERQERYAGDHAAFAAFAWPGVRHEIQGALVRPSGIRLKDLEALAREGEWVCALVGVDHASIWAAVVTDIPEPKALQAQRKALEAGSPTADEPAPKAKATRKPKAEAKSKAAKASKKAAKPRTPRKVAVKKKRTGKAGAA